MEPEIVSFYNDVKSRYFPFSNYYTKRGWFVEIDGKQYASTEHYFQAQKFVYDHSTDADMEYAKLIQCASTPNIARELAGQKIKGGYPWRTKLNPIILDYLQKGVTVRPDWDHVRVDVMRKAVRAKFSQDERLMLLLLETKEAVIVEDSPRDAFWGIGKNGKGENMLGKVLMCVRQELLFLLSLPKTEAIKS